MIAALFVLLSLTNFAFAGKLGDALTKLDPKDVDIRFDITEGTKENPELMQYTDGGDKVMVVGTPFHCSSSSV